MKFFKEEGTLESQPFFWIFRLDTRQDLQLSPEKEADQKTRADFYELRYFFEKDTPNILVPVFDPRMCDTAHYRQKFHDDFYYMTSNENLNLKIRKESLQIKEQVYEESGFCGFLKKKELTYFPRTDQTTPEVEEIEDLLCQEGFKSQSGFLLRVCKESMRFKFKKFEQVSIEFSRLCVSDQKFYSLCLESKNLSTIRWLAKSFHFQDPPLSYTSFLKRFLP